MHIVEHNRDSSPQNEKLKELRLKAFSKKHYDECTVIRTDFHSLGEYIAEVLGIDEYNIACAEEVTRGVSLDYNINGIITDLTIREVQSVRDKPSTCYRTQDILQWLCSMSLIPAGQWIIEVDW